MLSAFLEFCRIFPFFYDSICSHFVYLYFSPFFCCCCTVTARGAAAAAAATVAVYSILNTANVRHCLCTEHIYDIWRKDEANRITKYKANTPQSMAQKD